MQRLTEFTSRRWKRVLAATGGLYLLFVSASWLAVPWLVRRVLLEVPKRIPGFETTISQTSFDPFRLALTVRGFSLAHEQLGELAACDELYASLQPLDLLRLALGLRELRLIRPRLVAAIAADGSTALSYLPKAQPPASDAPTTSAFIPRVIVHRFVIDRGALEFESRLPDAPQRLAAYPITLALENFNTLSGAEGSYVLSARTNRDESLRWEGRLRVRPFRLTGRVEARGADLSREDTALPAAPVTLSDGRLDAEAGYALGFNDGMLAASLTGGRVALRNVMWNVRGSTLPPRGPFSLELTPFGVDLRAPLPTPPGGKATFNLDALVAGQGRVQFDAVVSPSPFGGGGRLRLTGLPLTPFSALAPPPTQVTIDSGTLSLNARVTLSTGAGVSAEASLSLDEFALSDLSTRLPFLKLHRFLVEGARVSVKSKTAAVQKVALDRPLLRVFRGANGRTNVESALGVSFSSPTAAAVPAKPSSSSQGAAPWRAELKLLVMGGGRVVVQDEAVAPPFALTVRDVSAELKDLSNDGRSTATFSSKGLIERAPYTVSGDVRLSSSAAWVSARVAVDGVQLQAFSPYSIAAIGYKLDKGSLNLNMTESLNVREILSQNKIIIDQLTLGDKVESPTAVSAPIKLGLAILKDRNGVINLDVPIEGSLDDPQFRFSQVVLKTLLNLIVQAATSPFNALSSMLGGGADLGHIPFNEGSSSLAADAPGRLDKIVKILADRPALFIGVRGEAGKADAAVLGAKMDASPAPGPVDLRALALERSAAVQEYLIGRGIAPTRFFNLQPVADGQSTAPAQCVLELDIR